MTGISLALRTAGAPLKLGPALCGARIGTPDTQRVKDSPCSIAIVSPGTGEDSSRIADPSDPSAPAFGGHGATSGAIGTDAWIRFDAHYFHVQGLTCASVANMQVCTCISLTSKETAI